MSYILTSILLASSIIFTGVNSEGFDIESVEQELRPLAIKLSAITGYSENEVLYQVFGELNFVNQEAYHDTTCWYTLKCFGYPDGLNDPLAHGLLIHELGHRFLNSTKVKYSELDLPRVLVNRSSAGYPHGGRPYEQHGPSIDGYYLFGEDFADTFMNWALDQCTDDEDGRDRCGWMDNFIKEHVKHNPNFMPEKGAIKRYGHTNIARPE